MANAPDVIRKIREQVTEIDPRDVHDLLQNGSGNGTVIVDVREQNEWDEAHIPGAVHVPR
ncbi:MAG: rhodanese-like domain-containing protein, partial [Thermoleophilaceae bacterium]